MITEENIKEIMELTKTKKVITTKQLNELGLNSYDLKKLVTTNLLERIKRGEYILKKDNKIDYSELVLLLKDKNYEAAKKVIERKKQLTKSEKVLYQLIDIANRINSNEIFPKRKLNTKTISEAIETNNFEAALKIAEEHTEYYKVAKEDNAMYIVLKDIVNLTNNPPSKTTLEDIYKLLTKETVRSNEFKERLTKYLEYTCDEKYEGLIYALIDVNQLENPSDFSNIINLLETIKNNNFVLKRTYYMKQFSESIENQEYDNAEIYLNVIECLEDIKEEHNIYKHLKEQLNKYKNISEPAKDHIQIYNREYSFLNKIITKLKRRKGMILLEEMSEEKRLIIHEILKKFPNINSATIGTGTKKRIKITYATTVHKPSNSLYSKAYNEFKNENIGLAICLHKKIIECGGDEHFIYGNLGILYQKSHRKEPAIDYLTVAYEEAKKRNHDTNDYLLRLKSLMNDNTTYEEEKPFVKIDEEEFNRAKINTYEINNLSDILYLIYEEKYTIEEACNHFNLTEEEINIVKLLIAKEEYCNKNNFQAEKLLKQVEKSKHKNLSVKKLFAEITKNKLFYKNRPEESIKNLIYVKRTN